MATFKDGFGGGEHAGMYLLSSLCPTFAGAPTSYRPQRPATLLQACPTTRRGRIAPTR